MSATNQVVNGHRSNENNMTVNGVGNLDAGANGSLINNVSPDFIAGGQGPDLQFLGGIRPVNGRDIQYRDQERHGPVPRRLPSNTSATTPWTRATFSLPTTPNSATTTSAGTSAVRSRSRSYSSSRAKSGSGCASNRRPTRQTLPSLAELQGNFVGTGHTIDEPGTKTPYPGDVIPTSQITTDGNAIANVYRTTIPLAAIYTNTAVANNTTYESPNPLNYREDIGRLDYVINDNHRLFAQLDRRLQHHLSGYGTGRLASHRPGESQPAG